MKNTRIPLPDVYIDKNTLEDILESNDNIITYSFPNDRVIPRNRYPIYNEGEELVGYRELDNLLCIFINTDGASRATGVDDELLLYNLLRNNRCTYLDWVFYPKEAIYIDLGD